MGRTSQGQLSVPSYQSVVSATSLKECYEKVTGLAHNLDELDVVEEVERYRTFWKPDTVRVLLLAESHVRTNHGDFAHRWSYGKDPVYEGNFVRFVYCLANGETSLVNIPSNKGTWQFWKILFSCLHPVSENLEFGPILRSFTRDPGKRMENKIRLLRDLKAQGVWLVDASIVGINGLAMSTKSRILRLCWESYTGPMLKRLDPKPDRILVIGTGVKKALLNELSELAIERTEIPQPQARIEGGYWRYYQECFEACSKHLNG